MSRHFAAAIPLDALSGRQRRLVESHLALVHLTLKRLEELVGRHRRQGQYGELVQEGCLALVEAVRSHDPARHGAFAPYAMARIHFAVSRYVHETSTLIRVPFITQRRNRRRCQSEKERHRPFASPRVVRLSARHRIAARLFSNRSESADAIGKRPPSVGEQIRERYEQAARSVAARMSDSSRTSPESRRVLRRCLDDRLSIPEPEEKTSLRELAGSLNCPVSRVMKCEDRFLKGVGKVLNRDATFQSLLRLSRQAPDGIGHRLSRQELDALGTPAAPTGH